MDDLHIARDLDASVVLGDEHDLPVLDVYVAVAAGGGVAMAAT